MPATRLGAGLTLRTFDLEKHQWSIYWVSSATGRLEPPVVGGFDGDQGEFYGEDQDNGRPVKARYRWNKLEQIPTGISGAIPSAARWRVRRSARRASSP